MKSTIIKCLPKPLLNAILKAEGLSDSKLKSNLSSKINAAFNTTLPDELNWKNNLLELSKYGKRYQNFIEEFIDSDIHIERNISFQHNTISPTLLCVVKNDLQRMKLLINHYRKLGVKCFAILDDHSDDGTYEFLLEQPDVIIFKSGKGYSTVRRQVWLNKMVSLLGLNRWYIVVDSDELFDYENSHSVNIEDFIKELEHANKTRVKCVLLDMFSPNSLYSDNVVSPKDIETEYCMYLPDYFLEKNMFDTSVKGGARNLLFFEQSKNIPAPVVSKYPLIKMMEGDILINSHYNFPFNRNLPGVPETILKHFKFLSGDQKKYEERAKLGNFGNNSIQYKAYMNMSDDFDYTNFSSKLCKYNDFNSTMDSLSF